MLWYLPLEHLDLRYTRMMDDQIVQALDRHKVPFKRVYGDCLTGDIECGAFLDSEGTNYFKASQLQRVCRAFKDGDVKDGDSFFVSDLWFPGIEAIPYMAMFRGIAVKVYGIAHAGSWTDTDFVRGLEHWAADVERGWFKLCEKVFVGSEFHRNDIVVKGRAVSEKIAVTGLVFSTAAIKEMVSSSTPKEDLVVFAGRLDDEKQPWLFDEVAENLAGKARFVKTYDLNLTKVEYFNLLAKAKVIFSAALQENFGYAVLEAATLGVTPVVPDRLAYREMWPSCCRYSSIDEATQLVARYLVNPLDVSCVAARYDASIDRMIELISG